MRRITRYHVNRAQLLPYRDHLLCGVTICCSSSRTRIARNAYRDFGKGRGTKAKLNFGDCFAYALARETRELLLYKGNDFVHTDIVSALKKH